MMLLVLSMHGWCRRYLAIDQGPIPVMIENYRTGLIWDLFMSAEEVTTRFNQSSALLMNRINHHTITRISYHGPILLLRILSLYEDRSRSRTKVKPCSTECCYLKITTSRNPIH